MVERTAMISLDTFQFIAIVVGTFCVGFVVASQIWQRIVAKYEKLVQEMLATIREFEK